MKTRLVNLNAKKTYCEIKIGRPTIFGNPWSHLKQSSAEFQTETREEAVENYRLWLEGHSKFINVLPERREQILKYLPQLKGKVLGCYCTPKACHGEVLVNLVENQFSNMFESETA